MGKYIIVENDREVLAQMYVFLRERKSDKEFWLVKCDYDRRYKLDEADEQEKKKLKECIKEESSRNDLEFLEGEVLHIDIAKDVDELMSTKEHVDKEDTLIMDITLFDSLDEQSQNTFEDYASVRYAKKLVEYKKINPNHIRFYTKSLIHSDPIGFVRQTNGNWSVPALRPSNFGMPGGEEEREFFAQNILREEWDK